MLLRDAIHELYLCYKKGNDGRAPQEWATLPHGLVELFSSSIRWQGAQAKLINVPQGKLPVWKNTSKFDALLGGIKTMAEPHFLMYTFGAYNHVWIGSCSQKPFNDLAGGRACRDDRIGHQGITIPYYKSGKQIRRITKTWANRRLRIEKHSRRFKKFYSGTRSQ